MSPKALNSRRQASLSAEGQRREVDAGRHEHDRRARRGIEIIGKDQARHAAGQRNEHRKAQVGCRVAGDVARVTAYTAATTTAVLRILSGNHFMTDVLTGALLGTLWGVGVPMLHTLGDNVEVGITPFALAFSVSF